MGPACKDTHVYLINISYTSGTRNLHDEEYVIETWTVKTGAKSTLPKSLSKMLRTARKYGVDINPPLPSMSLRKQMPVWFHKGQNPEMNPRNNGNWADCQRLTHDIWTVGEMEEYVNETQTLQHSMRKNCACDPCRTARRKG